MLVLRPDYAQMLNPQEIAVLVLQCLQNDLIGKKEARDMLFVNQIGAGN